MDGAVHDMAGVSFETVRGLFPTLRRRDRGRSLVYLDTAATALRPTSVIEAVARFYRDHNASVHRGLYPLAAEATELYEQGRERVARWLGVERPEQIVFTRNATAALNLLVRGLEPRLRPGDEILLTEMDPIEHPYRQSVFGTGTMIDVVDYLHVVNLTL